MLWDGAAFNHIVLGSSKAVLSEGITMSLMFWHPVPIVAYSLLLGPKMLKGAGWLFLEGVLVGHVTLLWD